MNHRPKRKDDSSTTALAAVAFQDHLVQSLSLDLPGSHKRRNASRKRQPARTKVVSYEKPWLQTAAISGDKPRPAGEYVLPSDDRKPPTLAEKMGLVEPPNDVNLSEKEWSSLKTLATERMAFATPCPICKEDIGAQEQLLLSCSHVFHRNCLQAFERFMGKKTCPLCREERYQARVVHEGTKGYRGRCATRIQAAWRGYIVRCWYAKLRETVPPKDERLRKAFFEKRLHEITDRLLKSVNYDVNKFLDEIDASLEASRRVFRDLDLLTGGTAEEEIDWEKVQIQALEREVTDCPICITPLRVDFESPRDEDEDEDERQQIELNDVAFDVMDPDTRFGDDSKRERIRWRTKTTCLLSCSHLFHKNCLESFERFSADVRPGCPICRSPYAKKVL